MSFSVRPKACAFWSARRESHPYVVVKLRVRRRQHFVRRGARRRFASRSPRSSFSPLTRARACCADASRRGRRRDRGRGRTAVASGRRRVGCSARRGTVRTSPSGGSVDRCAPRHLPSHRVENAMPRAAASSTPGSTRPSPRAGLEGTRRRVARRPTRRRTRRTTTRARSSVWSTTLVRLSEFS